MFLNNKNVWLLIMNILVTGAKGFVGKNLVSNLYNIKEGKNQTRNIEIENIFEYDIDNTLLELEEYCKQADFVFNLAGVNRPKEKTEFMQGNYGFASELLDKLQKYNNTCPVMLSSSIQASLSGKYEGSEYGESKLAGEKLFFDYSAKTGTEVLVYRFTNLFGKWCRPNYNSAVATFCNNIANDLPIQVNDESTELELLYIDDLVTEMLDAIEGKAHRCEYDGTKAIAKDDGAYCYVPITYKKTLGEIVELLHKFDEMPKTLVMPEIPAESFEKKLYSTYLSYLPKNKISYPINMNVDNRGIFSELIKSDNCGQVSINIARPGITRGEHWHNTKWEIFIVVSGHGLIQERKLGLDENGNPYPVIEFEVSGEHLRAVQMLPGYTHNIINLSDTENLVTIMWANEHFDKNHPDTFYEKVSE